MLDAAASPIAVLRSTNKEPLADADVRRLIAAADTVVIARGRSSSEVPATEAKLEALKGPTGKYRAPMVLAQRTLLVGFGAEALERLLAD